MIGLNYRAIWLIAAVAMMASGCRGMSGSVAGAAANGTPVAVVVISDNPAEFEPSVVTVKVGDTVKWSNTGGISHSVAFLNSPEGAERGVSQQLSPRATYSRTFTVPGTYTYACSFHINSGMVGKVVVLADSAPR